ncbi:MAG TPA: glycosyltransferase family 39 protein [Opitutaceae bacterium]|nr:glycosyltransferase family 39 protein [Opitutaceae bacterium]
MNVILQALTCCLLFLGTIFGLGLPVVLSWRLEAAEKLCAAAALGLVTVYLSALAFYWTDAPVLAYFALPAAAGLLGSARWRTAFRLLAERDVRLLLTSYVIATGWALGLLALVRSYSGASWSLDWADHYARALFFSRHWAADHPLFGRDLLTTRPPLANVVTGAFLSLMGTDFPLFQIFTTLASSLAFLPGWLLARHFSRGNARGPAFFALLYMLSPSVMENSTFAWTKLPTVFFVLSGLYFFLPAGAAGSNRRIAAVFALLAAGFLAHYSAGPYIVALTAAYFWGRRSRWRQAAFWRETIGCALPAGALLLTWFSWSVATYGWNRTFLSNSSVTESTARSPAGFLAAKGLNLYHTVVPHPLRPVDYGFIAQASRIGHLRDYFFLLYQVNLVLLFGSVGGVALLWLLWREGRGPPSGAAGGSPRSFWIWFVASTALIGIFVCGDGDDWGVAHLCLQSLLGLGLAYLGGCFDRLSRWWRGALAVGLAADFILGIGLQFFLENISHPASELLGDGGASLIRVYGLGTWGNLRAKILHQLVFVGDWPIARPLLVTLLGCLLLLALSRLRFASAPRHVETA